MKGLNLRYLECEIFELLHILLKSSYVYEYVRTLNKTGLKYTYIEITYNNSTMCRVFLRLLRPKFKIKYNEGSLCLCLDGLHRPNAKGCFVHTTIGVSIIEHMQWLSVSLQQGWQSVTPNRWTNCYRNATTKPMLVFLSCQSVYLRHKQFTK